MSQNNTFNSNQTGAPTYGQQGQNPYNQQAPYGQQQAYNQQMSYNQQQPYNPQVPNRPQPNVPTPPSGSNNKNIIIIGAIAAGVIIIGLVIALIVILNKKDEEPSTETASRNTREAVTEEVTEDITEERVTEEVTEAATEAPTEATTEASTEAATEAATDATTEEAKDSAPAAPAATVDGLSDDLYSEQVSIDGKVYHLPFDYSLISDEYTFDMADYGYEGGYVMNPEDKVTSTIQLENPNVDEDLDFYVGFVNTSGEAKDIKETSIYSVDFDITWTETTNYPSVVLPKGITWGATLEDVKAAYGEPDDSYYSDSLHYWSYTYEDDDYDYDVQLTIYEDRGITEIDLSSYKND